MTFRIGDDAKLREVLQEARKAKPVDRLSHVPALIEALDTSLKDHAECDRIKGVLLGTLKRVPVYAAHKPELGSEPIVHRWVVFKPAAFDRLVQQIVNPRS